MIFDSDDFGANHVISDQCQSHDCRDVLLELKRINPNFKATLFAIPGEMTTELTGWAQLNSSWIELAVHGFFHQSNYECADIAYEDFDFYMDQFKNILKTCFVKGFKAPGWQIGDDVYRWLLDNGYWVADQAYNNDRRPPNLKAYINDNGRFYVLRKYKTYPQGLSKEEVWHYDDSRPPYEAEFKAIHTHTWDCVGNGVYELFDELKQKVEDNKEWKFVSEVLA